MIFVFAADVTLLGTAAAVSTIIGVALAILSHKSGQRAAEAKAAQETHDELLQARKEAEELSAELHKLKMERNAE